MDTGQSQTQSSASADYRALTALRDGHPAWRLMNADHSALIISFLHRAYLKNNVRTVSESDLTIQLDEYLYQVRLDVGDDAFPRAAGEYLEDWASDKRGWLRKYYPADSDEPHFDIATATEQAIEWAFSLRRRAFIGTESRLLTVFELLQQLVEGTETDPHVRIADLERRRKQIDGEIARIREGVLHFIDETGVRERFLHIANTARTLLSDFRAVEQNFRDLDRAARERIATWEGGKGDLLAEIFGERDAIAESDQGKSFRAFWDFLLSPARQEELSRLLEQVFALEAVQQLKPDRRILRIHYDWLAAGESTQRTVAKLSAELRRYLDDKAWLENRRIMQLLHDIEANALGVRDRLPTTLGLTIDGLAPELRFTMDRPLFRPPEKSELDDAIVLSSTDDIPADALFDMLHVDKQLLTERIHRVLQQRSQTTLAEVVQAHPLEHGLAELVAYFSIAAEDDAAAFAMDSTETIAWTDSDGRPRRAIVPVVIFARSKPLLIEAGASA